MMVSGLVAASFWAFLDREHEPADSEDRQNRAGDVEAGLDVLSGMGNDEHGRYERHRGEEHGDREHPRPSCVVDDRRRGEQADDPAAPATPAQVPIALARSAAGKLVVITDKVTGMIIAAARPATTRKRDQRLGTVHER